jgi:hypothetical protein
MVFGTTKREGGNNRGIGTARKPNESRKSARHGTMAKVGIAGVLAAIGTVQPVALAALA